MPHIRNLFCAALLVISSFGAVAQRLPAEVLRIDETHIDSGSGLGFPVILGTATNTTADPIGRALVKINLLDAQGNLVGNTLANASDIGAGQAWHFKAPVLADRVASYQIVEVILYR